MILHRIAFASVLRTLSTLSRYALTLRPFQGTGTAPGSPRTLSRNNLPRHIVILIRYERYSCLICSFTIDSGNIGSINIVDAKLSCPSHKVLQSRAQTVAHRPHCNSSIGDMTYFLGSQTFLQCMIARENGFRGISDVQNTLGQLVPCPIHGCTAFWMKRAFDVATEKCGYHECTGHAHGLDVRCAKRQSLEDLTGSGKPSANGQIHHGLACRGSQPPGPTSPQTEKPSPDRDDHAVRDAELFARIEYLMQTEGVYRQNDLTIERLAERLDTNRTYISRAINQQAGKTFSSYVNSYRIDEAVRRLSDVDDDTPLKALAQTLGYNHLQTFYTSFQSAIGMPPSKYREKLLKLHREHQL